MVEPAVTTSVVVEAVSSASVVELNAVALQLCNAFNPCSDGYTSSSKYVVDSTHPTDNVIDVDNDNDDDDDDKSSSSAIISAADLTVIAVAPVNDYEVTVRAVQKTVETALTAKIEPQKSFESPSILNEVVTTSTNRKNVRGRVNELAKQKKVKKRRNSSK